MQLAKRAGLFVVGVAGSSKGYAKELGADVVVDYRDHAGEALVGLDLIFSQRTNGLTDVDTPGYRKPP